MKQMFHHGLQNPADHFLRNAVAYRRNTQRPRPTIRLRYVHTPHWRRHVTARRQSIPELIEVIGEPSLKLFNGLPIYSSRSLVGFHMLKCFPDQSLRYLERLCLVHAAPPIADLHQRGWPHAKTRTPQPLRSSAITAPSSLLRTALPLCFASVLKAWRGSPARLTPFTSKRQVPTFRERA
jgi:hypothetical protein